MQKWRFCFTCKGAGKVKGYGGEELHGLIFGFLGSLAPEVATTVHRLKHKPLVLTPLTGPVERQAGWLQLYEGQTYNFDLTVLSVHYHGIAALLAKHWPGQGLRLGSASIRGDTAELVEQRTYRSLVLDSSPVREVEFNFATPTSFRQRGTQLVFPLPENVFNSLQDSWNKFSPLILPDFGFPQLKVKKYRLETELVLFSRYSIIGFVGRCCYEIPRQASDIEAQQIACLATYSSYAGVGYKTTMGLGHVHAVELKYRRR